METGIDLVDIKEFRKILERSGNIFLEKVFTSNELKDKRLEHLAGIFCVKECAIKVGLISSGQWLKLEVRNDSTGKPLLWNTNGEKISNISISISHTKTTCVAVLIKF